MQSIQITLNHLPIQPGQGWSVGVSHSAEQPRTGMTVRNDVHSFLISNEQFKAYPGDLGMT